MGVRYLTKIRLPLTNKNVSSPNDLALAGRNMTGTDDDDKPQKRGQKHRGHKNLRQKSKSSSRSSSDKPEAGGSETRNKNPQMPRKTPPINQVQRKYQMKKSENITRPSN